MIEAESNFQNKPVELYQLVISNNSSTIVFTGMTSTNEDSEMKVLKNISKKLKIREID